MKGLKGPILELERAQNTRSLEVEKLIGENTSRTCKHQRRKENYFERYFAIKGVYRNDRLGES